MPQITRTKTSDKVEFAVYKGARTSRWVKPANGNSVLEIQTTWNPQDWKDVPVEKNLLIPPYHFHWYQTEYFKITSGRFIFTLEGVQSTHSASPNPVVIPAAAHHTFRVDPTSTEPCTVEISAAPADSGLSEKFFRNLYSYRDDCAEQCIDPSLPQLLLMMDSAEMSLAMPGPRWLMNWVSWGYGVVVGRWYGGWVLGLKDSYEEYWEEKKGV